MLGGSDLETANPRILSSASTASIEEMRPGSHPYGAVAAVRDLRKLAGETGGHIMECDDGRAYLVKFKDRTRTVINEHVGHSIARMLDLPVPEGRLVSVGPDLIQGSSDLRVRGIAPGIHHGSVWLEGCEPIRSIEPRPVLANERSLPGMLVLDNFVLNWDRSNFGNNLTVRGPQGTLEYVSVDFGEILAGPRWTLATMEAVKATSQPVPTFRLLALSVTGMDSFSPWLEMVESFPSQGVEELLSRVPVSWEIGRAEREAISDLLMTRRGLVRGVLESGRPRFHNWR